jgi:AraC-like DNA-binding protein
MSFFNEGRLSDSPYIDTVWQGWVSADCAPICPASGRWHMLLIKRDNRVQMSVEGPMTRASLVSHTAGTEWLVIKFTLGTFMPHLPINRLLDSATILPDATDRSFWMHSAVWELPTFDNVETFVHRLAREGVLVRDQVVEAVLQDHESDLSIRTVRRRFLHATGLTRKTIQQIERAQQAVALLEQGKSILDTVYEAGYFDQAHMTRALKSLMGQTPAQIARLHEPR